MEWTKRKKCGWNAFLTASYKCIVRRRCRCLGNVNNQHGDVIFFSFCVFRSFHLNWSAHFDNTLDVIMGGLQFEHGTRVWAVEMSVQRNGYSFYICRPSNDCKQKWINFETGYKTEIVWWYHNGSKIGPENAHRITEHQIRSLSLSHFRKQTHFYWVHAHSSSVQI